MPTSDDIAYQYKLLKTVRDRVREQRISQERMSIFTPPYIINDIAEGQEEIKRIKTWLAAQGEIVEAALEDGDPPILSQHIAVSEIETAPTQQPQNQQFPRHNVVRLATFFIVISLFIIIVLWLFPSSFVAFTSNLSKPATAQNSVRSAVSSVNRIMFTSIKDDNSTLWNMDQNGNDWIQISVRSDICCGSVSPSGNKIALVANKSNSIIITNLEITSDIQAISDSCSNGVPTWSPDERKLVFQSDCHDEKGYQLRILNLQTKEVRQLIRGGIKGRFPSWSPSNNVLAFVDKDSKMQYQIYSIDLSNSNSSIQLTMVHPGHQMVTKLCFFIKKAKQNHIKCIS